jgi:NAD(P)H dehydrogenase (quinone)
MIEFADRWIGPRDWRTARVPNNGWRFPCKLTGPKSEDMRAVAAEYSAALGRTITCVDVPMAEWRKRELRARGLPEHVASHIKTMAQLPADNRYDRLTHDFEALIGRPATSIREYVAKHPELFGSSQPARVFP